MLKPTKPATATQTGQNSTCPTSVETPSRCVAPSQQLVAILHAPPIPDGPGLCVDTLTGSRKDAIVDEVRLAHLLDIDVAAIQDMVKRGELPAPIPFAGRKVWLTGHIVANLEMLARKADFEPAVKKRRVKRTIHGLRDGSL